MATIINNPASGDSSGSGMGIGFLLGVLLLILAGFAFFYYGLPALRRATPQVPAGTQITIPDKVDVNVNQN